MYTWDIEQDGTEQTAAASALVNTCEDVMRFLNTQAKTRGDTFDAFAMALGDACDRFAGIYKTAPQSKS